MANRIDGVEALRIHAQSLAQLEQVDEAAAALERATRWAIRSGDPYAQGQLHREAAVVALHCGDRTTSRRRLDAARRIFGRLGATADLDRVERVAAAC